MHLKTLLSLERIFFATLLSLPILLHSIPVNPPAIKLKISVKNYADAVIENNLKVKLAKNKVDQKRAIYEENVKLKSGGTLKADFSESQSGLQQKKNRKINVGWKYKALDSGTQFATTLKQSQFKQTEIANPQLPPKDIWNSELGLEITQPLLPFDFKDLRLQDNRQVDVHRFNVQIERANYNSSIENLLKQSLALYWQYVVFVEEQTILKKMYQDTKKLLQFNRRKAKLGAISQINLLASEAALIKDKMQLEKLNKTLLKLKSQLLDSMGYDLLQNPPHTFQLTLLKLPETPPKENVEDAYKTALDNRNELKLFKISRLAAQNALELGKMAYQPNVNLILGANMFNQNEKYGCSFCGFKFDKYHTDFKWGFSFFMYTDILSYKVPTARPKLMIQQSTQAYQDKKKQIQLGIEEQIRSLQLAYQNLQNTKKILELQKKRYQIALKDYFRGKIDASLNTQYQNEFNAARRSYFNSKYNYQIAAINLQFYKGTLLKSLSLPSLNPYAEVKEVR